MLAKPDREKRKKIGAKFCFTVSSVCRKGGLTILWFEGIELEIVNFSNYHMHSKTMEDSIWVEWFLTGFYGIPETSKRVESWDLLKKINHV